MRQAPVVAGLRVASLTSHLQYNTNPDDFVTSRKYCLAALDCRLEGFPAGASRLKLSYRPASTSLWRSATHMTNTQCSWVNERRHELAEERTHEWRASIRPPDTKTMAGH